MARRAYKIERGGAHERFQNSRKKIQMFGGGFGNGKTTGAVIKTLMIAKDYPGANILVARSTYPKLTATIRKEIVAWCPKDWIVRDVDSKQNLIELKNGTVINFSHIQQTGKGQESSTSNLLSATYDLIVIDQVEDPEITHKDFLDLLGRLRGQTPYAGNDPTMPSTGPRWMILMCNPTRNWVYRKIVKPIHDANHGIANADLLRDPKTQEIMVDLIEASTYENKNNLPEDFIATQEAAYKGQIRERFLLGKWGAYAGLVYPEYNPEVHLLDHHVMHDYFSMIQARDPQQYILEAYDHGIAQPACYFFAFTDPFGNVFMLDGFYQKELTIKQIAKKMTDIRSKHGVSTEDDDFGLRVLADPAIFRRSTGTSSTVGVTTSGLFREEGIRMTRGNNDIVNGIAKVQSYLYVDSHHEHPITGKPGSPRFFVSKNLEFFDREIVDYYWKKDTSGEYEDVPNDKNDHAMDTTKYLLTNRPRVVTFNDRKLDRNPIPRRFRQWREIDTRTSESDMRKHRYG